ncbi:chromosome segregation protein SMC [Eremococcus coleocola]|uniref:chromosome segregation protein SMC n=1 Tax=Eremococcus coleocola TaxID=88132 RepID=UPI00041922AD|nr:chromosome segregation protein SMC [Eremococcus coleocola]
MHLSRVEMTGFKSFADKTVIEFDQGMTAVVGPNGSGKSNLSEAIRWVLGEQSAKSLRGSKMEDVIFNGTQDRKAVNIAKVTLVLNNEDHYLDSDYSEIAIARSYNRNGDSSYTINNETVRLKDIVDLLLDSGLGKNSFSIISQGQVEQIFLNKPEERRTIFEEAAGVQKYQYRKNEAERKLTKSQDNLNRVKDIIHELKQQLDPLAKQKDKALIYLEKSQILKELEISLYSLQIKLAKNQWAEFESQLKAINLVLNQLEADIQTLQNGIKDDKDQLETMTQTIEATRHEYFESSQKKQALESQIQILQTKISNLGDRQADRQANFDKEEASNSQLIEKRQELIQKRNDLESILADLHTKLEPLNQDYLALTGDQSQVSDQLRNEIFQIYQSEADYKNKIQQYKQEVEGIEVKNQSFQTRLDDIKAAKAQQGEQITAEESKLHQLEAKEITYREKIQASQANYQSLKQAQAKKIKDYEDFLQKYRQNKSQEQHLSQMQVQYVGFYAGVRAVMQAQSQLDGIHGTLADLIQVEASYQIAIDTALGAGLQNIVVTNDQAAGQAVAYLKKQKAGRATFLPLSNIRSRSLASHLYQTAQRSQGFVDIASQLVKTDDQYRAIIESQLGTTVVVDTLANAQNLARALNQKIRIVTLEGEMIQAGGAVTGGRNKNRQESVLEREGQLKAIKSQNQKDSEKLQVLDRENQALNQSLKNLETEYNQNRQQLQETSLELQYLKQSLAQKQEEFQRLGDRQIILEDEFQQASITLKEDKAALLEAQEKLKQVQVESQQLQARLQKFNSSQEDRQNKAQVLNQDIFQLKTDINLKEYDLDQVNAQLKQLEQELQAFLQTQSQFKAQEASYQANLMSLKEDLAQQEADLAQYQDVSDQLPEELESMRQERKALSQTIREAESQLQTLLQDNQAKFKEQARLEARIDQIQVTIDNQLLYLNQEYQLSFEAAQELSKPVEDEKAVLATIKQLKVDIQSLGPINLNAIEDYDQLADRYDLLVEQEEDLLAAMAQLQETMDEMDQEVIKRFGQTFKVINEQFQLTFRRLFSGGQAQLELTQPDNLLTTGVDIIAQPPGKKKQHLALLSGGERALTAIALLFAILEVKPVPFVILDEVEAALDDANVFRYGEYIQSFTDQTQFIVITHRKGTMESADVLYGVTMEQSGVSKLASVKLTEAIEEIQERGTR